MRINRIKKWCQPFDSKAFYLYNLKNVNKKLMYFFKQIFNKKWTIFIIKKLKASKTINKLLSQSIWKINTLVNNNNINNKYHHQETQIKDQLHSNI